MTTSHGESLYLRLRDVVVSRPVPARFGPSVRPSPSRKSRSSGRLSEGDDWGSAGGEVGGREGQSAQSHLPRENHPQAQGRVLVQEYPRGNYLFSFVLIRVTHQ